MFQLLGNSIRPGQTFKDAVCQANAEGDMLKATRKPYIPETVLFLCPKDEASTNLFGNVLFAALSNMVIKHASQSRRKKKAAPALIFLRLSISSWTNPPSSSRTHSSAFDASIPQSLVAGAINMDLGEEG